ncbi:hypothetical protein HAX54_010664 [Datura stramonium]|uniref:RRM domain-containing protein n=1 Tax=Datura stramonium TaxID=4076 RepID=A0ABS8TI78_DATST|nr:hypothetical protein [Datura stramonium]
MAGETKAERLWCRRCCVINLVADPKREGLSRGFAFLEFSCHTDAMTAYKRLQRPDVVFGHSERTAKIAFAEPLRDPDPEVMAQVKSVFIDGLPPYWDEDRIPWRNLNGVNNTELGDGNLKAKVRARLSNPQPKTQAVKGGISGGFRLAGPMGRGFPRGGNTLGRANFPLSGPYPPFRGRSNFGRGGRWNFSGAHPVFGEGPMFVDRMRHGVRGHADDAFFRRQQFPIEGLNRPLMDRHFEDRCYYDNTDHGLKRPFSMTTSRFDHSDSASSLHGGRYRDNFPGGDHNTRDNYGSDYGRGPYPSFYGGGHSYGRGLVVVIISLDEHLVSSDGRMFFLTIEWDFSGAAQKGKRISLLITSFPII